MAIATSAMITECLITVDYVRVVFLSYANILILQEYRDFPFEIYEWIHVIDRYTSEITSLVNNTV